MKYKRFGNNCYILAGYLMLTFFIASFLYLAWQRSEKLVAKTAEVFPSIMTGAVGGIIPIYDIVFMVMAILVIVWLHEKVGLRIHGPELTRAENEQHEQQPAQNNFEMRF